MTISLEQLKIKINSLRWKPFLSIPSSITIGLFAQTLIDPYSREFIPIPNLGGIFYRSIFIVSILWTIWTYRYGLIRASKLCILYYGFQELIFTIGYFGAYNSISAIVLYMPQNLFWSIRVFTMFASLMIIVNYKLYRFTPHSVISGAVFFTWFIILLAIWPFSYFNGEGNIPLEPIPQIEEFLYNLLFPLWFYFLVKLK